MKKIVSISLVLLCILSLCFNSYADNTNTNDSIADYVYTDADKQNLIEKERLADEMYRELSIANISSSFSSERIMPSTREYLIPVTNFKQEKSNWCGAACVLQTISFHRSINGVSTALPTQADIARKLGIYSSGGASSTTMANVLNQYKSTYGYSNRTYSTADLTDKSDAYNWFYTRIRSAIVNQTYAPIILIETGQDIGIYRYYAAGVHCRHYNTIGGIRETTDAQSGTIIAKSIQTVDPHYDSRFRGKYWDSDATVYNSIIRADNNGSNRVLIY